MAQTGTYSNEETIRAWADIVIKIWRAKIVEMKVWDTGALYSSFLQTLTLNAGNNVSKVEFAFNLYGVFQDIGLGREIWKIKSDGDKTKLKRREWYSKVFYGEVMKLKDILVEKYGEGAADSIIFALKATGRTK